MAWVYILRSASGRFYIGSTTDLERRVLQHQSGHTYSTKRLGGNLEVFASLQMPNLQEARHLEREMKAKKNPKLAFELLQRRSQQLSG